MATNTQSSKKLYTPIAVLAHTLLFTPVVGGFLVFLNWRRSGQTNRGWIEWLSAIAVLGVVALVGRNLSLNVLLLGLVAAVAGISASWLSEQQQLFANHKHAGGEVAPSMPVTLVGAVAVGLALASYVLVLKK